MKDLQSCRTLIVDDDEDSRFILQCLLEKLCLVETAENAAIGLHKIEQWKPDLVLLDINMPGEDGFALCRRLQAASDISSVPVIFISASTDAEDVLRGFSAGAVDFINKPFDISEVNARVTAHLRQQLIIQERSSRLGKVAKDLAALEQSYLFFADHSADVFVRCGPDSVVRHINRQWTMLTGLQTGNPIGRPVEELAVESDRALLRASIDEAFDQKRELLRVEFSVPTPGGPISPTSWGRTLDFPRRNRLWNGRPPLNWPTWKTFPTKFALL
jgi:CheY-like chemotaxis protein